MEYRQLGGSGLRVSLAGLGTNNFGARLDQTATTDVVQEALEASLRRLGTDYLDLYQVHLPDPRTPIEETLRALDDLMRAGTVRYIGSSNFAGWQVAEAEWAARARGLTRFVSAQNEWSLLQRDVEAELIPACGHFGVGMLPYFPLASGFLTGKYRRSQPPPVGTRLHEWRDRMAAHIQAVTAEANWDRLERLTTFAEEHGHRVHDLALSWLASQHVVSSVIAGATSAEQVRSNTAATQAWAMSAEERAALDAALAARSA